MDKKALRALINESDDSDEGAESPDPKMMMFLVAAAKSAGVDLGDKSTVSGFIDQLKALVTRDKSTLMAAMRKYKSRDLKGLSKLANRA